MPRHRSRAHRGFTLVELTMVVAIMAVLAALAAPRYSGALHRYRAAWVAQRVADDLKLAQNRARMTSSTRSVVFTLASSSYQLIGETDFAQSSNTYTVRLGEDPYFGSLVKADFGGSASVSFNGYGIPSSAGEVVVESGKNRRSVILDETGGIKVQ